MKTLFVAYKYPSVGGGKIISSRNRSLLAEFFGSQNVIDHPVSLDRFSTLSRLFLTREISSRHRMKDFSLVFADNSMTGLLTPAFYRENNVFTFFHNVEGHYLRQDPASGLRPFICNKLSALYERTAALHSHALIALNSRDSRMLKSEYGRPADLILPSSMADMLGSDPIARPIPAHERYLLFVGLDFFGNTDGLFPFIRECMPHLNCTLKVVGVGMDKYQDAFPEHPNVSFSGFAEDLSELYRNAAAVVLPITSGSGMKTKTCEALMYGKTIFGTPEAFEGYENLDPVGCVLCRTNQDFIDKLQSHLSGDVLSFCRENRKTFLDHYSTASVRKTFFDFLDRTLTSCTILGRP